MKEPHSSLPLFSATKPLNQDFTSFSVTPHCVCCALLTALPPNSSTCPALSPYTCWSDRSFKKKNPNKQTKKNGAETSLRPSVTLSRTVRVLPPPRIAESFSVWLQHTLHHLLLPMMSCEGTVSAVTQLECNQSEIRCFSK